MGSGMRVAGKEEGVHHADAWLVLLVLLVVVACVCVVVAVVVVVGEGVCGCCDGHRGTRKGLEELRVVLVLVVGSHATAASAVVQRRSLHGLLWKEVGVSGCVCE